MGYQTPNIDRIAREGIEFTDYYRTEDIFINPIETVLDYLMTQYPVSRVK